MFISVNYLGFLGFLDFDLRIIEMYSLSLSLSLCEFSAVVSVWFGSNLGVSFCRLSKLIFSAFLIGS